MTPSSCLGDVCSPVQLLAMSCTQQHLEATRLSRVIVFMLLSLPSTGRRPPSHWAQQNNYLVTHTGAPGPHLYKDFLSTQTEVHQAGGVAVPYLATWKAPVLFGPANTTSITSCTTEIQNNLIQSPK